jgi:NADH-quinone oxidoreductase subunit M
MPIGLDNFSVLFIILTSFLFRLTFLSCWVNTNNVLWFFELLFITEFILFFVFTVLDPFWFLIAYESIIVPVFLIIGILGGRAQRVYAAYPSPHYTFAGSVAMSSSIIHIYLLIGSTSFLVVVNSESTVSEQVFLFSAFPIAFASKLPLYPFHSWSPEAHVEAPTAGSVSLAGISLKMGGYGLIRWCFPLFPVGITMAADLVNTVAGLSVSYASFPALQQLDIKKIIAYSSIAHMGFVVMGLFTSTELGLLGAIFLMVTHGFISAGLFPCIGVLYDRYGTRSILYYGGLGRVMPLYDTIFFVLCLANIALPGTAGFPGESSISYAVYSSSPSLFGILLLGVLTTGIYTIWMYSRVMMGPIDPTNSFHKFSDVSIRELCMFGLILIPVLVLGLFPTILFHIYNFWILKWIQVI